MGSPRVTNIPELLAVFSFTPSDDGDLVGGVQRTSIVTVDTTRIVIERLWNGNTASDRASLVDLLHHVLLTVDQVELVNLEDSVLVGNEASLTRVAVAALHHCAAHLTVVQATGHVDRACLIGDLIVCHVIEGVIVPATVAPVVLSFA